MFFKSLLSVYLLSTFNWSKIQSKGDTCQLIYGQMTCQKSWWRDWVVWLKWNWCYLKVEPIEWAYENIGEITSKGQLNNMADFLAAKQLDLVINLPMRHGGARRVSSFNTHGKSPAHSISVIIGAVLSACLSQKIVILCILLFVNCGIYRISNTWTLFWKTISDLVKFDVLWISVVKLGHTWNYLRLKF